MSADQRKQVFSGLLATDRAALLDLDAAFVHYLSTADSASKASLAEARASAQVLPSSNLIAIATALEVFIAKKAGLQETLIDFAAGQAVSVAALRIKWKFVKRKGVLVYPLETLSNFDGLAAEQELSIAIASSLGLSINPAIAEHSSKVIADLHFANAVQNWQSTGEQPQLELAAKFAAWACQSAEGQARYRKSVLFRLPAEHSTQEWFRQFDVKQNHLVSSPSSVLSPTPTTHRHKVFTIKPERSALRQGFNLTDAPAQGQQGQLKALDQADYCLKCHNTGKDSCSHGLNNEKRGCPLQQKISEFLSLRAQGKPIAALAMIVLDNPMVAATGHRICNDCSQACIYQQQTPVDIPMAETQVLLEVLAMPFGFEIYALLTRWNPLNTATPLTFENTGHNVLVGGLGPAGFTLAHYLLQLGHNVVAVDGLKLQALPEKLQALIDAKEPIEDIHDWFEPLSERPAYGFGGVAEYGITSRWEKNFLTLIRILLARRPQLAIYGDVRLGSSLTVKQAFTLGFDHVSLGLGAGAPKLPTELKQAIAPLPVGVRTASDFLMALHTGGARKPNSDTNLQLRLPVVVIGGGLTGVDAATEALAYYPIQVARYSHRWQSLNKQQQVQLLAQHSAQDSLIHNEFLTHAQSFSALASSPEALTKACIALGGATLIYRKSITESPAFTLNSEELSSALAEGISVIDNVSPVAYQLDEFGAVRGLIVDSGPALPARSVILAIGTQPNSVITSEEPDLFTGFAVEPAAGSVDTKSFAMATLADGRWVSRIGDLHPGYAGSVVKAMASSKAVAPLIDQSINEPSTDGISRYKKTSFSEIKKIFEQQFSASISEVIKHSESIIELVVHAPALAKAFKPGQFFRLQSISNDSIEPLAMTGASANVADGTLSMVILASGASSLLAMKLAPGNTISLMGPTGEPSEIPHNKNVLLIGGGLGNAVLFSIGKAMRENGCHVTYFAGYKTNADVFTPARIEAAADTVVWCCDQALPTVNRASDHAFKGNVVQALQHYKQLFKNTEHMLAIGSDRMMAAVAHARKTSLIAELSAIPMALASINSPMQCMMKAICGQCLQTHVDPQTGEIHYVFSCQQQDQPIDQVDFKNLSQRLSQNRASELLSAKL